MALNLKKITHRPYKDESDLPAMVELINACEAVDKLGLGTSLESLRTALSTPDRDRAHLWENADGTLVGTMALRILTVELDDGPSVEARMYYFVHPEARNGKLETEVIEWAANRLKEIARERGLPGALVKWINAEQPVLAVGLEKQDFKVSRHFLVMSYPADPLPPEPRLPDGFVLRTNGHAATEAWVELYNQSFMDHYRHHPTTVELVQYALNQPDYKPEYDLVAFAPDGRFAAFCLCEMRSREASPEGLIEGWMNLLGTRRSFRSLGLGKAVLLAGMRQLISDGAEVVRLIVDADSPTGANRLYEAVGFQKYRTYIEYAKGI